jgi:hypothetical protein
LDNSKTTQTTIKKSLRMNLIKKKDKIEIKRGQLKKEKEEF